MESYSSSAKFIEDQIPRITLCVIPPRGLHLAFGIAELCQDELVDLKDLSAVSGLASALVSAEAVKSWCEEQLWQKLEERKTQRVRN